MDTCQSHAGIPELVCLTPWMGEMAEPAKSAERHLMFRAMALNVLQTQYPWLVRVLESAGAQVLAMQGKFFIAMPNAPEDWIQVPELSACLHMVPWREDGEEPQ